VAWALVDALNALTAEVAARKRAEEVRREAAAPILSPRQRARIDRMLLPDTPGKNLNDPRS